MKFDTVTGKSAEHVGDIKTNNVSIDTNNIDFIVTILSTNLYSRPIESFVRETVSNAWDSHIEANNTDPVILELGTDSEGVDFCRIQDFGVGLSPERFDKIYKNIGSSTKRTDNSQIGGFGIGRFSALAYSDVVTITSNHEGKQYIYMMYKDGNSIAIDLLHSLDTDEKNGLEVKVNLKDGDYPKFVEAIKTQLVYFENLYVEDNTVSSPGIHSIRDIQEVYNSFAIKKYKHFWVNTLDATKTINLILGKVRYPIRISSLSKDYPAYLSNYPISLKLDIGDLEVTPNREEILYSPKNQKVIEDKLDLAIEEISDLIEAEKTKDFSLFKDYLNAIENKQYLTLLEAEDQAPVKIKVSDTKRKLTYKGVYYDPMSFKKMYDFIMNMPEIPVTHKFINGQIKNQYFSTNIRSIKNSFDTHYLCHVANLKNIAKRYIRDTFVDNSLFIKPDKYLTKKLIKTYMKNIIKDDDYDKKALNSGYHRDKWDYDPKAFKVIVRFILKNLKSFQTFDTASVPGKWIADTKAADKAARGTTKKLGFNWSQNVNLHVLRYSDHGGGVTSDSKSHALKDLSKKNESLTVYAEKKNPDIEILFRYLKKQAKIPLVTVAPTKMKILKNIDNFVNLKDFMDVKYKLIRNIGTVVLLKKEFPELKDLSRIRNLNLISEKLYDVVQTLEQFRSLYENDHPHSVGTEKLEEDIYKLCEDKNYFNEEIRGLFNQHKKELENARVLLNFINSSYYGETPIPEERINLLVDYFLKTKRIRPSVKAVLKLKSETIFNIIPEENESN